MRALKSKIPTIVALIVVLGALVWLVTRPAVDVPGTSTKVESPSSESDYLPPPKNCPAGMVGMPGGRVEVVYQGPKWNGKHIEIERIAPFCIDKYEASQPDATATFMGSWRNPADPIPAAQSKEGVYPWVEVAHMHARQACANAGKKLPTLAQWQVAFSGLRDKTWPWGEQWENNSCYVNYRDPVTFATGGCCFPVCENSVCTEEICDMVGNVSEWIDGYWEEECYGKTLTLIAGGASHYSTELDNQNAPDPAKPGCWGTLTQYSLKRAGLHFHKEDDNDWSDDGFRCVMVPEEGALRQ